MTEQNGEDAHVELLSLRRSTDFQNVRPRERSSDTSPVASSHSSDGEVHSDSESTQDAKCEGNAVSDTDLIARVDEWWLWEILGLVLSAGILIAIIIILRVYDGKQQPSWTYISLNTLLSWLSTVGKGCVLFPVSQGLSQLKWVWFAERKRSLSDLMVFDKASRGLYGSAELLWDFKAHHLAAVGSFAVLLALGFDPFIQNLVHYYPSTLVDPSQVALLANSSDYSGVGPDIFGADSYYVDPTLKGNVYNSLFSTDSSKPWGTPQYTCSTGNCTWDPIALLSMRSFCSDITSRLETKCGKYNISGLDNVQYRNCTVSLPQNGTSAWYSTNEETEVIAMIAQSSTYSNFIPLVYTNTTFPVIQYLMASGANAASGRQVAATISTNASYVATECYLQPTVRSIKASVNGSVYQETTLAEWIEAVATKDFTPYTLSPNWTESLGMKVGQTFSMSWESWRSIEDFISILFTGYVQASNMEFAFMGTQGQKAVEDYATSDTLEALFYGNMTGCPSLNDDRLRCAMDNVAEAISKSFRDQAYTQNATNASQGHTVVNVTNVKVRWQWLTLPLIVWVLSTMTWLGTMWKTRRASVQKWRDNPLPLLFLYREESDARNYAANGVSGEAYVRRARAIRARLCIQDETKFAE